MNKLVRFTAAMAVVSALVCSAHAAVIPVEVGGDIAAAVAAAQEGDVVQLAPGEYTLSATVTIGSPITVRGLFAACTKISASGTGYSLFKLTDAGAVLERVTLTGATAATGAGAYVTGGTVQDAIITKNNATATGNAGGGVWLNGANCVLRRCRIEGNTAKGYGGGVYAKSAAVLESCFISANKSAWGGGIYSDSGSSTTVAHCTFFANTGPSGGPDVYDWNATEVRYLNCVMSTERTGKGVKTKCVVSGSQTEADLVGKGAALTSETALDGIDLLGSAFKATAPSVGCTEFATDGLKVNWTGAASGGLGTTATASFAYENRTDAMTIETALYDPAGTKVGGSETGEDFAFTATEVMGSYTLITTVTEGGKTQDLFQTPFLGGLSDIHVSTEGTGAFPYGTAETALKDIQEAIDACLPGGTVTVHDGTYVISKTLTVEKGLTLRSENGCGQTTLAGDTVTKMRLVYINHAEALVEGFTIRGGQGGGFAGGTNNGGGALIGTAGGTLDKCIVANCWNGASGGGMALMATNAVVRRTIFRENSTASSVYGGGIYIPKGGGVIDNCLFYGNSAKYGGAIYADGSGLTIRVYNTTALDNMGQGGNICNYASSSDARAVNTISTFVGFTQEHCCGSTVFTDQTNHDYTLAPGATAVDTGVDYEGMCETDLVGKARKSGEAVDIGAYERSAEALAVDVAVDVKRADFTGDVVYTLTPSVAGASSATLDWTILRSDGAVALSETGRPVAPLAFRPTEPGCYSVRVVASDGDRSAEAERPELFVAGTDRVFIDAKGGNVYPYATAETAATNFHAAWSMVGSTAVVTVAEGTYDVRCCLDLSRNIRIVGAGWDKTVLRSSAAVNDRLLRINNPEASISGCALTGVRLGIPSGRHGACVNVGAKGGLVEDCLITNNVGNLSNGMVCFEAGSKGVLRRCTIGGNSGGNWGGAVFADAGGGAIDNCLLLDNDAKYGGGLYVKGAAAVTNCTIIGNLSLDAGWSSGRFANCYIASRSIYEGEARETTFTHCASSSITWTNGVGNIKVSPGFVDSANKDYHLKKSSLLRKTGLATPLLVGLKDRDGNARVANGVVDIGCYQTPNPGLVLIVR